MKKKSLVLDLKKSAVHPRARLKYRLIDGEIVEYGKVTKGRRCLGWKPTQPSDVRVKAKSARERLATALDGNTEAMSTVLAAYEFVEPLARELACYEPAKRVYHFYHWVLSQDHARWVPADAESDRKSELVYDEQSRQLKDDPTELAKLRQARERAVSALVRAGYATGLRYTPEL